MDRKITTDLLERYARNECSREERELVKSWLENNDDSFEEKSHPIASVKNEELEEEIWQGFSDKRAHAAEKGRLIQGWIFKMAAACAVVALGIGGYSFYKKQVYESGTPVAAIAVQETTFTAPEGKVSVIHLPDNSTVTLTPGTTVRYPTLYADSLRVITLVGGEAFFEIKHDASQPFVVSAADAKVQVLGTKFNIRNPLKNARLEVTLTEGSIRFSSAQNLARILKPGEQLGYDKRKSEISSVTMVDTRYTTAWTRGILWFKETPLEEVLDKMAMHYQIRFEVSDDVDLKSVLNGKFDNKTLPYVLHLLENSTGYTFRQKGNMVYVSE